MDKILRQAAKGVFVLVILMWAFTPTLTYARTVNVKGLDTYVKKTMKQWQVPSLAVALVKGDKVVYMKGYGVREIGKQQRVDENTVFPIGSASKAFTSTSIGLLVQGGKLSVSRVDSSMGQRVQAALDAAVAEYNVPGAVLALGDMNGNTRIWTSGLAELETKKPISKDLYFMIGSTTKSYTATMVLQLVDDGLIKLDDPIGKYLPGLVPRENKITIRHLLEMRSGLGAYGPNPEFVKFMEPDPLGACKPEVLVKFSLVNTIEPDREFHYTNVNYILLGMLIEKVTNNSLSNEMKRRILQPLGMSHTFMLTELKMPTPYAHGYLFEEGKVVDATYLIHPSLYWTAGGIVSTAADQLIWAKALVEGRLLSPQAHSEQFNMKPAAGRLSFYGFGVMNMNGLIGHGGNVNNMYTSFVGRYHGYDVAILVNGQAGDSEEKTFRAKAVLEKVIKETGL